MWPETVTPWGEEHKFPKTQTPTIYGQFRKSAATCELSADHYSQRLLLWGAVDSSIRRGLLSR